MKNVVIRHWFLVGLLAVLTVGITQAGRLEPLANLVALRYTLVACVLFVMALPLEASAMWQAVCRPWPPLLAVSVNFGLLPLSAWGLATMLSPEMAGGLYVAAATPTTLASAAVWTRRAGGNDSVAILVTVITNLSCFVVSPLWLFWMTGQNADEAGLRLSDMIVKLGLLVVLPMALAQLLRVQRDLAQWATQRKWQLSIVAQCGILSMVLLGAIRTGLKLFAPGSPSLDLVDFSGMVIAVITVHLCMLYAGLGLSRLLGLTRSDGIAVGIAGSQKTLMVGLQLAIELNLSVLPIVVYHVSQLVLDTLIADRLRRQGPAAEEGG